MQNKWYLVQDRPFGQHLTLSFEVQSDLVHVRDQWRVRYEVDNVFADESFLLDPIKTIFRRGKRNLEHSCEIGKPNPRILVELLQDNQVLLVKGRNSGSILGRRYLARLRRILRQG